MARLIFNQFAQGGNTSNSPYYICNGPACPHGVCSHGVCHSCAVNALEEQAYVAAMQGEYLDYDLSRICLILSSLQFLSKNGYSSREMSLGITRLEEALSWLEKAPKITDEQAVITRGRASG